MASCSKESHEATTRDPARWAELPKVGVQELGDGGPDLELRNCGCGSTLSVEVNSPETPDGSSAEPENRRWVACRRALGREPRNVEFIVWINERWAEFAKLHGREWVPSRGTMWPWPDVQARFDAWLSAAVAS
jgi:hypothetical protein